MYAYVFYSSVCTGKASLFELPSTVLAMMKLNHQLFTAGFTSADFSADASISAVLFTVFTDEVEDILDIDIGTGSEVKVGVLPCDELDGLGVPVGVVLKILSVSLASGGGICGFGGL
mmetsp:Transcript_14382/g.35070  ORF Transcript_14382/g.35070 Transcript_14382/m.35070 type:complete len:117 (+) Transcript_14382:364-714(+)